VRGNSEAAIGRPGVRLSVDADVRITFVDRDVLNDRETSR
jgi:hypothetical protein